MIILTFAAFMILFGDEEILYPGYKLFHNLLGYWIIIICCLFVFIPNGFGIYLFLHGFCYWLYPMNTQLILFQDYVEGEIKNTFNDAVVCRKLKQLVEYHINAQR